MKRKLVLPVLAALTVLIAACSPATSADSTAPSANESPARTDTQGAVVFVVTPLDLAAPGETFDFDVSMNTHSVDLSWNLAAQSVLRADTGLEVAGQSWPVGNGHHYQGTLAFPAKTAEGKSLLAGAKKLTLTIRDTDVSERVFEWELTP